MTSVATATVTPALLSRLQKLSSLRPRLAFVLGSGFHHVLQNLEVAARLPYAKLPGFPRPGVAGHAGELLVGTLGGTPVYVLNGRAHYYEGYSLAEVTFPVRVLAALGAQAVLLTNAAGGINRRFRPGDFMLLTDHINLMGDNPLRGPAPTGLPRFVDLTHTYDAALGKLLFQASRRARTKLQRGVYLAVSGPSYETPAEIRAFAHLGAAAVGMSTVPEAIVARQLGLRVAALSCITNLGAGLGAATLSHDEVLQTAQRVKLTGAKLLLEFSKLYGKTSAH
jgi:purine-nucleoside phosphorylase